MISISDLTVAYTHDQNILQNLNLKLEEGLIHGLVGLNGAGKTTLLNTLFGIIKPKSGSIDLSDQVLSKKLIGYMETENYFYSYITGEEYLQLFANPDFDVQGWNRLFELPLGNMIDNYSTGMKKKLALMGILKLDKPIMILDEPFNGLDLETSRILQMIILRLKLKRKTIIITSHILESLTTMCDHIHYLEGRQIKFSRSSEQFGSLEQDIFHNFPKTGLLDSLMNTDF